MVWEEPEADSMFFYVILASCGTYFAVIFVILAVWVWFGKSRRSRFRAFLFDSGLVGSSQETLGE